MRRQGNRDPRDPRVRAEAARTYVDTLPASRQDEAELAAAGINLDAVYEVSVEEAEEPSTTKPARDCRRLVVVDEFNYGMTAIEDDSDLLERLREWNIAYCLHQDAKYEWSSRLVWWHPGMPAPERCDSDQDGQVMLGAYDFATWANQAERSFGRGSVDAARAMLARTEAFFARTPWEWSPVAPADREEVAA